jgi:hypothetical protein
MTDRRSLRASPSATHFDPARLAVAGAAAAVASVAATVAIRAVTVSVETIPSAFSPLHTSSVVMLTIVGVVGATLACLALNAVVANPLRTFRRVVPFALALSFIPDVAIWAGHAYQHTARASTVVPLLVMHVAVASICLYAILALGRRKAGATETDIASVVTT